MELTFEGVETRTGQRRGRPGAEPVRRHSRLKGRFEGTFWRPFKPEDVGRYLDAARAFDKAGKKPGDRKGPLGLVAIEVLRALLEKVDYATGRLDPELATLAAMVPASKDTVVRALAALRRHGFVDWIRRYEPTGNTGPGPRVKQASNAYRLALPPAAARLLGLRGRKAPLPDDLVHARAEREAEFKRHLAQAEPEERNATLFGRGALASAFSRFERAVASKSKRESDRRSESHPDRYPRE